MPVIRLRGIKFNRLLLLDISVIVRTYLNPLRNIRLKDSNFTIYSIIIM